MPQDQPTSMEPILSYNNSGSNGNNGHGNVGNGSSGYGIIGWFEDVSKNAASVQTQMLCQILKQNHGVEYLNKWLGGAVI